MNEYIILDKNIAGHQPKKFTCPNCNKKRFVRYYNTVEKNYLPETFGRCDRESSCGHFHPPNKETWKDFYSDNPEFSRPISNFKPMKPIFLEVLHKAKPIVKGLDYELLSQSLNQSNIFLEGIKNYYGQEIMEQVKERFLIGSSSYWKGASVFWQLDQEENLRTGKVMLYDHQLKRVKKPYNHVHWVHKILEKQNRLASDFSLTQCYFGEHQLKHEPLAKVVLVESAKTAILASIHYPEYLWLSTEGSHGFTLEKSYALIGREVYLCPDFDDGCRIRWKEKAKEISETIPSIRFQFMNPAPSRNDGSDLADLILDNLQD